MTSQLMLQKRKAQQLLLMLLSVSLTLLNSCKPNEPSTESELMEKINAVHTQMMKQGNITEEEKLAISGLHSLISDNDGTYANSLDGIILYKDVAKPPIYSGCDGSLDNGAKKCFNESISKFIQQEFDSNIATNSESEQVAVFFVIDENGDLSSMKIRDTKITVQAEIARVLRKIPKMKPATQDGINVPVLCSILVTYGSELTVEHVYIPAA